MNDEKLRYLVIEQGRTLELWWAISETENGEAYDLEDNDYVSGVLQVRTAALSEGGVLLYELSTDNGGIVFEYIADDGAGGSWSGYLYATHESTAGLIPFDDAVYDFYVEHSGGTRQTVSRGPAMLIPQVSE